MNLTSLTQLNVRNNQLSGTLSSDLQNLQSVNLRGNNIVCLPLGIFENLHNLLSLRNAQINKVDICMFIFS